MMGLRDRRSSSLCPQCTEKSTGSRLLEEKNRVNRIAPLSFRSVKKTSDRPLFSPSDPGKCVWNDIGRRWAIMSPRLLKRLMRDLVLQFKRMTAKSMARDSEALPESDTSTSHWRRPATETESPGLDLALITSAKIVPSVFGRSVLEVSATIRKITSKRTDTS